MYGALFKGNTSRATSTSVGDNVKNICRRAVKPYILRLCMGSNKVKEANLPHIESKDNKLNQDALAECFDSPDMKCPLGYGPILFKKLERTSKTGVNLKYEE